jgi:hypothetical protein
MMGAKPPVYRYGSHLRGFLFAQWPQCLPPRIVIILQHCWCAYAVPAEWSRSPSPSAQLRIPLLAQGAWPPKTGRLFCFREAPPRTGNVAGSPEGRPSRDRDSWRSRGRSPERPFRGVAVIARCLEAVVVRSRQRFADLAAPPDVSARVLSLPKNSGDLAHPHVEADCLHVVPAEWPNAR